MYSCQCMDKMHQRVYYGISLVWFCVALSECLPQWANQRLVFTVFEVNNTWNEAREVCRNNERWLLSMEDSDAWSMWKHLMDPSVGLPRRPHDVRYWMDIHARYPSNMSDLYHDNCSQVSYTEWWADPYRHTYVIEDPCVAFDAYWRPFTDLVLKNWFGVPCQNGHYFICIKLMDELPCVTSCEESIYLFPNNGFECTGLCGNLGSVCQARFLTLDSFTICHVIKSHKNTSNPSYNICFFPTLYGGLTFCGTQGYPFNLSYIPNIQATVTDLCAETTTQEETTEPVKMTSEQTTTEQTTEATTIETTANSKLELTTEEIPDLGTTSQILCECPCSSVTNVSDSVLTIEEKVEKLRKELTVNKQNTSAHRRSKISVADHRVSATSIGSLGVVILSVIMGSICLMDLTNVRCDVIANKCCKRKSKKIRDKESKSQSKDGALNLELKPLEDALSKN